MVKWKRFDFFLVSFIVVYVIVIDCGEIIFFVILFEELVVIERIGFMLIDNVVIFCRLLNSRLVDVFELVMKMLS